MKGQSGVSPELQKALRQLKRLPVNTPKKVLTINADVADAARLVSRSHGLGMSAFIEKAIAAFLAQESPELFKDGK